MDIPQELSQEFAIIESCLKSLKFSWKSVDQKYPDGTYVKVKRRLEQKIESNSDDENKYLLSIAENMKTICLKIRTLVNDICDDVKYSSDKWTDMKNKFYAKSCESDRIEPNVTTLLTLLKRHGVY